MSIRLRSIDVIRGLAASAVVIHHAYNFFPGQAGVDFFFVISGYVIFHAAQRRPAGEFIKARFKRIFPIYWVALLPWLLIYHARGAVTLGGLFENILLLPAWLTGHIPYFFLAWTLVIECLFYFAAAVTIWLRSVLPMLALLGLAIFGWGVGVSDRLMWLGNPLILEFLFGVVIAVTPKDTRAGQLAIILGIPWFLLASALPLGVDFRDFTSTLERLLGWGVPAALIVYGAITFETKFKGRIVAGLCTIGAASYSIYLFHALITHNVDWPWRPAEFLAGMALGIAAWAFIERPLNRRRPSRVQTSSGGDEGSQNGRGAPVPVGS